MRNGYSLFRGFASLGKGRCLSNCPNGYKKEMNPAGGYKKLMLEVELFYLYPFLDYLISLPHEPNFLKFFFYNVPRLDVFQCSLSCRPQK